MRNTGPIMPIFSSQENPAMLSDNGCAVHHAYRPLGLRLSASSNGNFLRKETLNSASIIKTHYLPPYLFNQGTHA